MSSPVDQSTTSRNTRAPVPQRSRMALWIAAAVVGLALGYLRQYSHLNGVQNDLARTQQALQAARLEAALGAAVIEAQSGRYEVARQRASDFYTGLQRRLLPVMAADRQAEARTMLSERDSIITTLARNDPTSAGTLASVLVRLRETIHQAELDTLGIANR